MLYVVLSDAGGATVPYTWRYYVHSRIDDSAKVLDVLRDEAEAFLVTRDGKAQVEVQGTTVKITLNGAVYSFRNQTLFRHAGGYTPVNIWLAASPPSGSP
ncbi:hypothetical protein RRX38_08595 [Pseudomonas sp. DTU_2021_1001937_2_SI_NGA_ILE_001]|uniref:hypothetical protein n=1 Tax=Pseudomonas sp. DTU_2021_1001937_2_SI_NGA_ILE_001 TaxID=3077589 RepID=UPI0028FC11CD|nr:hypothetical protein [Pseudomonas sp. DTU_2021_1001937_2_SI_NGA_ILE_001]WNW11208.1 hypothetical protein RRX38_08595 [Pseudomonas sp. DTU_2021_1001937_2_SI_NGA_ILE_001]